MISAAALTLAETPKTLARRADSPFTARVMSFPAPSPILPSPVDHLLTLVAQAQDKQAFSQLFDHFAPRLNAYMRKLGSDAAQAEELVQETMLAVWRKAPSFDPAKAGASTWIYTIARNKRIDSLRRQRPEVDETDLATIPAEQPEEDPLDTARQQQNIETAIASLPAEQADLLRLAYYSDMPHSEIAAVRKLPLGTVKSRLRLALDKMRRILKEEKEA